MLFEVVFDTDSNRIIGILIVIIAHSDKMWTICILDEQCSCLSLENFNKILRSLHQNWLKIMSEVIWRMRFTSEVDAELEYVNCRKVYSYDDESWSHRKSIILMEDKINWDQFRIFGGTGIDGLEIRWANIVIIEVQTGSAYSRISMTGKRLFIC